MIIDTNSIANIIQWYEVIKQAIDRLMSDILHDFFVVDDIIFNKSSGRVEVRYSLIGNSGCIIAREIRGFSLVEISGSVTDLNIKPLN